MNPTIGRIVMYRLSSKDVEAILKQRENTVVLDEKMGKTFDGNTPQKGDVVPLIVVKTWPDEYTGVSRLADHPAETKYESTFGINGQAILDGNDSLWVTSAPQHQALEGAWYWPPREETPAKK